MNDDEKYIEHEVQIRLLQFKNTEIYKKFDDVDKRFDKLENKIDDHFKWMLGIMFTVFMSVLLTKLI